MQENVKGADSKICSLDDIKAEDTLKNNENYHITNANDNNVHFCKNAPPSPGRAHPLPFTHPFEKSNTAGKHRRPAMKLFELLHGRATTVITLR
ncbi:hypothetical protein PFDG_05121 [Plasmodium falciparum Dd2]|uniref:Uncharacterized protein n=1 Tax=Plasmodium falciparum (isolate Dd2) TaxID=57267 RepID=A0A0L7M9T5_PLAF4|nr:hypothetical protein PFDG_05121 [Plasmodium falciparum Dd2]